MEYRIGQVVVDGQQRSLSCDGQLISTEPRQVGLLIMLIEAAPEPVTNASILAQLWPDTVVSDWSVSRLVSDTRKLVKQAGLEFVLIQTVHGRGYRLSVTAQQQLQQASVKPAHSERTVAATAVAIPDVAAPAATVPASATPASLTPKLPWLLRWGWLLSALLSVALALLLWQWLQPPQRLQLGEPVNPIGRILWVDDHPQNNLNEVHFLQQQRVAVYTTTNSHEALMLLSMYHYDAIISDMGRADEPLAGLKLVQTLRQRGNDTPYLMYTILPSAEQRRLLQQHGAQGVAVEAEQLYQLLSGHLPLQL